MTSFNTLCNELRQIFEQVRFNPVEASVHDLGEVALSVFPRPSNGDHPVVSVVLTAGLTPPSDLKFLYYGVFDENDELVGAGRTGALGEFLARIPAGTYRVRYVPEPAPELAAYDCAVLDAVDDGEARAMLEELLVAQVNVPRVRSVEETLHDAWTNHLQAASYGEGAMFETADPMVAEWLPEGKMIGLSINGKWFCVDVPAQNISDGVPDERVFPYGVLLVEYLADDSNVVGQGLLVVGYDGQRYKGRIRVDEITDIDRPLLHNFRWEHIGTEDDEGIGRLDVIAVRKLLQKPLVKDNAELRRRIDALLSRIEGS